MHTHRKKTPPSVVVISGPAFHGKSAVGAALQRQWAGSIHLDVDCVRNELVPTFAGELMEPRWQLWTTITAYEALVERAEPLVAQGKSVILSGTFSRSSFKLPLMRWLQRTALEPACQFFVLKAREPTIVERIATRNQTNDPSPIKTLEQYQKTLRWIEPWWPGVSVTPIITDAATVEAVANQIMSCVLLQQPNQ